jgi:hypothetical protein
MLFEIVIQRFFDKSANNIAYLENYDRSRALGCADAKRRIDCELCAALRAAHPAY